VQIYTFILESLHLSGLISRHGLPRPCMNEYMICRNLAKTH